MPSENAMRMSTSLLFLQMKTEVPREIGLVRCFERAGTWGRLEGETWGDSKPMLVVVITDTNHHDCRQLARKVVQMLGRHIVSELPHEVIASLLVCV